MKNLMAFLFLSSAMAAMACSGGAATATEVTPQAESSVERYNGVYQLVRLDTPNGPTTTQKGLMILQDGSLCHLRVDKERERIDQDESDEDTMRMSAAAFTAANSACGTFTLEGGKVTATWIATLNPNRDGSTSEFIFSQEEDLLFIAPAGSPEFKYVYQKVD
ncbi:MAG: hypothetical protein O6826_01280 [Acidobacteria bacterium]|nr:hypothetical protein [Acidobacteriota bacterium]